jgi:hypothetical protein
MTEELGSFQKYLSTILLLIYLLNKKGKNKSTPLLFQIIAPNANSKLLGTHRASQHLVKPTMLPVFAVINVKSSWLVVRKMENCQIISIFFPPKGCSFYAVDGKNLCQVDYMNSLEKCEKCKMPITQKILRALGKAFHPECFSCPSCQKSLDGIPFTVDKENCAYCLDCYHERFSPRCAACLKVIAPVRWERMPE